MTTPHCSGLWAGLWADLQMTLAVESPTMGDVSSDALLTKRRAVDYCRVATALCPASH